ncbi:MAG: ferredoxin [Chitinispirillaceae bacterium]
MRAKVDEGQCIGCGLWSNICPEVFKMAGDEQKVEVYVESVPDTVRDRCREAAHDCLFSAIDVMV